MYYLLTESFKSQEAKLVNIILEAVPAEKIYMLGSTLQQQRTESIFMTDAPSCHNVSHYWLLVLVDKDCGLSDHCVQDKIENNCRHFVPVTAIVINMARFNNWLMEGHPFACTVIKIAVLLHDGSKLALALPAAVQQGNKTDDENYCNQGMNRVNEFMAGAELFRLRQQNKMAAFMLHQAAEQVLLTIFKMATGLHISSHNIDKLLRYCAMVNYKISTIFLKDNEAAERQLRLLQEAYVGARYKEDYSINGQDIISLTEKVKALLMLMQERLNALRNAHPNENISSQKPLFSCRQQFHT